MKGLAIVTSISDEAIAASFEHQHAESGKFICYLPCNGGCFDEESLLIKKKKKN